MRDKILFIFYCFIQARNFKATGFNILFLLLSNYCLRKWQNNKEFIEIINYSLTLLANNIKTKFKKSEFFSTSQQTEILDKSIIYSEIRRKCVELSALATKNSALSKENQKILSQKEMRNFTEGIKAYFENGTQKIIYENVSLKIKNENFNEKFYGEMGDFSEIHFIAYLLNKNEYEKISELLKTLNSKISLISDNLNAQKTISLTNYAICLILYGFSQISDIEICETEIPTLISKIFNINSENRLCEIYKFFKKIGRKKHSEKGQINNKFKGILILLQIFDFQTILPIILNENKYENLLSLLIIIDILALKINIELQKIIEKSIEKFIFSNIYQENFNLLQILIEIKNENLFIFISNIIIQTLYKIMRNLFDIEKTYNKIIFSENCEKCEQIIILPSEFLRNISEKIESTDEVSSQIYLYSNTNKLGLKIFFKIFDEIINILILILKRKIISNFDFTDCENSRKNFNTKLVSNLTILKQNLQNFINFVSEITKLLILAKNKGDKNTCKIEFALNLLEFYENSDKIYQIPFLILEKSNFATISENLFLPICLFFNKFSTKYDKFCSILLLKIQSVFFCYD